MIILSHHLLLCKFCCRQQLQLQSARGITVLDTRTVCFSASPRLTDGATGRWSRQEYVQTTQGLFFILLLILVILLSLFVLCFHDKFFFLTIKRCCSNVFTTLSFYFLINSIFLLTFF